MIRSPNSDTSNKPDQRGVYQFHFGIGMAAAAALAAILSTIGQTVHSEIQKTVLFCVATFFALQIPLILAYSHVFYRPKRNAAMLQSSRSGGSADSLSPQPSYPNSFAYEQFDLSIGEIWEKSFGYIKVRVELLGVLEGERPSSWSKSVESCVEISINNDGGVFTCSSEAISVGVNRFCLFRNAQTQHHSLDFHFMANEKSAHFQGLFLDHPNIHAKTAKLVFVWLNS